MADKFEAQLKECFFSFYLKQYVNQILVQLNILRKSIHFEKQSNLEILKLVQKYFAD